MNREDQLLEVDAVFRFSRMHWNGRALYLNALGERHYMDAKQYARMGKPEYIRVIVFPCDERGYR